jgi:hypothetical protein
MKYFLVKKMVIPNKINKVVRDLKMSFIRGPRNKKFKNRWSSIIYLYTSIQLVFSPHDNFHYILLFLSIININNFSSLMQWCD